MLTDRDNKYGKNTKLNDQKMLTSKGGLFKSAIEPNNKTISDTNNSISISNTKSVGMSDSIDNRTNNLKEKKKLSSGVVRKFDKAIALTSRITRVSIDNKKQGVINGNTGSSLSYNSGNIISMLYND